MTQLPGQIEKELSTDLARSIFGTPLCDTHEHIAYESDWIADKGDVLSDLLRNYVPADLLVAGATDEAIQKAQDPNSGDLKSRLEGVLPALELSRYTGYGEVAYLIALHIYGIETITVDALEAAQPILDGLKKPGERLRLLRDVARVDHVQIDDFVWPCLPDDSGEDFFFYDLSWVSFCSGEFVTKDVEEESGVEIKNLSSLEEAMRRIFDKYAPCAIAVKSQHAYARTLEWQERDASDVQKVLEKKLAGGEIPLSIEEKLCLGDWCWAKGIELTIEHNLPFKHHTGYYAGNRRMPVNRIRPGHICPLFSRYQDARFLLMHIGYPYQDEMVALAKHYPNVAVDMCWAWSIDPYSSKDFLRRMLHAVPVNRVMVYGGDTRNPTGSLAYSIQARNWITKTLEEEIADGFLSEPRAIEVAQRWMRGNQYDYFQVEKKRETVRDWEGPRLGK
jgi:hypothetical protein